MKQDLVQRASSLLIAHEHVIARHELLSLTQGPSALQSLTFSLLALHAHQWCKFSATQRLGLELLERNEVYIKPLSKAITS